MRVTTPCEWCRHPIDLHGEKWARRLIAEKGNRLGDCCEQCVRQLDDAATADDDAEVGAFARLEVDRAVNAQRRAAARIATPFRMPFAEACDLPRRDAA